MDDKKLIATVRQHKQLYDIHAINYNNQITRDQIWEEIGMKLGTTGKRCKTRWSYLRDLYTKSQKNRRAKRTKGHTVGKPWKYESEMEFLNPFLGKKQRLNPLVINKERKLNCSVETLPPEESMSDINPGIVSPPTVSLNCASPSSNQNSTCALRLQTNGSATFVQDYSNNKVASSRDALMKYFEAVAETVRGFSPALQVKVKSEISRIVHQAEMEDIQQSQFEPFLQSTQDLSHMQFSADNQAHASYSFECAATKQEQPG